MKIEEGKYYRARNGAIYGPMLHVKSPIRYPFRIAGVDYEWGVNGFYQSDLQPTQFDLISEVYVSDTPPDPPLPDIITDQPCKTLRDRFAGYALIGLTAAGGDLADCGRDEIAKEAWRQADSMLEARKK
jgi:hypothetical protein